jgi:Arc/MetJ-type ribon-helix-helix transcriptional regulator
MFIEQVVALLIQERDRLERAIAALQENTKPLKKEKASVPQILAARKKRKPLTAAQKQAHSERMRAYWAAKRKAKG